MASRFIHQFMHRFMDWPLITLLAAVFVCFSGSAQAQAFDAGLLPKDIFFGDIEDGSDVDVLIFEALRDTKLTISLAAKKPGALLASLKLVNLSDASVVAQVDAIKSKLKLVVLAPETGPYRLEISSSDGSIGPYQAGYKEKLSKTVSKIKVDEDVAGGADFDTDFDALQGFQLSGKLQRFPKKSGALPGAPDLLRPNAGGAFSLDANTLKVNKKGDRYTLKKAVLDASGTWTLRSVNGGTQGGLRSRLSLKRIKQKKRKILETASPDSLPAPSLDSLLAMTAASNLPVSGSDVMPFGKVQVEGGAMTVVVSANADGEFAASVPLKPNAVQSLFVSQLLSGEQGLAATHEVVQDSSPPTLIIDFPVDGAVLGSASTNVSGRVGDLLSGFVGLSVTVNGSDAAVSIGVGTNGSFDLAGVPLDSSGATTLEAIASDVLGNTTSTSINVLFKESTGASLDIMAGDNQMGSVQSSLATALTVRLSNAADAPLLGRPVSFRVVKSDGMLSTGTDSAAQLITSLSDAQGLASVQWQLGSDAGMGNNRVEVTASGVPGALYFNASAAGSTAKQLAIGTGNDQMAQAGSTLSQALSVWVTDGLNGVAGVSVSFDVDSGEGGLLAVGSAGTPVAQLNALTDLSGHAAVRWVLGETVGLNEVSADFSGNQGDSAKFRAQGLVQEFMATRFNGLVLDNSKRALGGALCEMTFNDGTTVSTSTGVDGRFEFDQLPLAGQAQLAVHGDTATTLGGDAINSAILGFPELHFSTFIVAGAPNALPRPVLLPPLDPTAALIFDGSEDLELMLPEVEGLRFFLAAETEVRHPDGSLVSAGNPIALSLSPVHVDDIPMPFADGANPPFAWTLQPGGTTFDPPLSLEMPNLAGLPAGAVAYFISFNHATMRFEIVSNATVSADATKITSDPGQGITVSGWGGICPPYPNQATFCPSDDINCLLPPELMVLTNDSDDEETDEIEPAKGSAQSAMQSATGAPGSESFNFFTAFVDDSTQSCAGSAQQCAIDLEAVLASGYSASAVGAWSLEAEAITYKMLMSMLHGSYTDLRSLQADAHALGIAISWPIALADTALNDFQASITAFDPAAFEAARQQVENDYNALVLLLAQLASGNEGASLQDLTDLFAVAAANAATLNDLIAGFDELALHVDGLDDLLLMKGATVRSGFNAGQVDSMGGYVVPNIPVTGGPQRVEVVLQAGDITLYGRSVFVATVAQQGTNSGPIVLSATPLAELVSMEAELMGGLNVIDTLEVPVAVSVMADFSDGSSSSLVGFDDGLSYSSSNATLLSVDVDGMATAHQAGLVLLSVNREGSVSSFLVNITPGTSVTTVSGMVVDNSMTPVVGADVTTNEGGMGTSIANGLFDLVDELASSATLDVSAEMGMLFGFTLDVPVVSEGTTQAGFVVIDLDTDGDGLPDWYETNLYATDPALADSDGDGLDDGVEVLQLGTDPTLADSDSDSFDDGTENALGSDPNVFDAPTTVVGSLMLEGGGVPANGLAHILGVSTDLFEAPADGGGDFSFAPFPASLTPVVVLGSAPGGFAGSSAQTATVPNGTTDVGDVLLDISLDPLYLGRRFDIGQGAIAMDQGDMDGDGRPDLAICLQLESGVEILLGQANGSFVTAGIVTPVAAPQGLALDDFDGDDVLDLAVSDNTGAVHIFLGNGDGSFTFDAFYNVVGASLDVLSFDCNGDLLADLHMMTNGGNVTTLLGNGDGTFGAANAVLVENSPRSMKAGLINGDAFMDIAVTNVGGKSLSVLLGDGAGSFVPLTPHDFPGSPGEVALGLFDNDAVLDAAVGSANTGSTRILIGNGDGTFNEIAGLDAGFRAQDLLSLDLDKNGTDDLVQATPDGKDVRVMLGNGDGTFAAFQDYGVGVGPGHMVVADLNGDGELDAAVANTTSKDVSVLLGVGDGSFRVAPRHDTGSDSVSAALGDVDGDTELDLLVANRSFGSAKVLLGDGLGDFGASLTVSLPSTNDFVALAFFDGDSNLDMLGFKANSDTVQVRLGLGNGDFGPAMSVYSGSFLTGIALGTLDAGNTVDLLVTNRLTSDFTVLLGNGDGTFVQQTNEMVSVSPGLVQLGDLDGNGSLDAVMLELLGGGVEISINDGSADFSPAAVPFIAFPKVARGLQLADLDGNGELDIIATSDNDNALYVLLGNGDGSFGALTSFDQTVAGVDPTSPVSADFNGDGAVDVALLNAQFNQVAVLLGDGAGGFLERQIFDAGPKARDLLVGQLDADGLPDLIVINEVNTLSWVLLHQ